MFPYDGLNFGEDRRHFKAASKLASMMETGHRDAPRFLTTFGCNSGNEPLCEELRIVLEGVSSEAISGNDHFDHGKLENYPWANHPFEPCTCEDLESVLRNMGYSANNFDDCVGIMHFNVWWTHGCAPWWVSRFENFMHSLLAGQLAGAMKLQSPRATSFMSAFKSSPDDADLWAEMSRVLHAISDTASENYSSLSYPPLPEPGTCCYNPEFGNYPCTSDCIPDLECDPSALATLLHDMGYVSTFGLDKFTGKVEFSIEWDQPLWLDMYSECE